MSDPSPPPSPGSSGSPGTYCAQINLHKSSIANAQLNEWLYSTQLYNTRNRGSSHRNTQNNTDTDTPNDRYIYTGDRGKIALVQEPHVYKGRVTNINKDFIVYKQPGDNVRACIITTKNIQAWLLNQFCDTDQATIATKIDNKIIVWCSIYMPYDSATPPSLRPAPGVS